MKLILFFIISFFNFYASTLLAIEIQGLGLLSAVEHSTEKPFKLTLKVEKDKITEFSIAGNSQKAMNLEGNGDYKSPQSFGMYYYFKLANLGSAKFYLASIKMPSFYENVGWAVYTQSDHWIRSKGEAALGEKSSPETLLSLIKDRSNLVYQGDVRGQKEGKTFTGKIQMSLSADKLSGHITLPQGTVFSIEGQTPEFKQEMTATLTSEDGTKGEIKLLFFGDSNPDIGGTFEMPAPSKYRGIIALKQVAFAE